MLYQSTSVGFGYGLYRRRCFLEAVRSRPNPIRDDTLTASSRPGRLGNINPIPIGYGFRPRLRGPANPARINLAQEPLDFRREGFSPSFTLLMSAFALPIPPACLTARLHRPTERSATACAAGCPRHTRSFGAWLEPRYIFGAGQLIRPVSYYAFFKGWLLLSQPPGCLGRPTSFPT